MRPTAAPDPNRIVVFPFRVTTSDSLLAATAIAYDLTLVTADRHLLRSKEFATLANR